MAPDKISAGVELVQSVIGLPPVQDQNVRIDRGQGLDYPSANALYFGAGSGLIRPATVNQFETGAVPSLSADLAGGTNIGGLGAGVGRSAIMASAYTKVTLIINNGTYGRAESHVLNRAVTDATTETIARQLAVARAYCLGSSAPFGTKSLANPQIEFISIRDAQNPRIGRVLKAAAGGYFGPGSTTGFEADFLATAITLRLLGQSSEAGGPAEYSTLQIVGQPDQVVQLGAPYPSAQVGVGVGFWAALDLYLFQLLNGGWGFMGQSVLAPNGKVFGVSLTVVGGAWQVAQPGHPYSNGDRVRVTGANAPGFNGVYRVAGAATNTWNLGKGPPISLAAPTYAVVQRVQMANGQRTSAFFSYQSLVNGPGTLNAAKVSKKNPGRQILGVTFRRRPKRLH
jgi:hypothetical protein